MRKNSVRQNGWSSRTRTKKKKKKAKLFRYFWAKQLRRGRGIKKLWGLWTALNVSSGHTKCSTKLLSTILCYGITERRTHSLCVCQSSDALCKYTHRAPCTQASSLNSLERNRDLIVSHSRYTLCHLAVCNIYSYFVCTFRMKNHCDKW